MKEITHLDADNFWNYLAANFPEIDSQLSNRAFVGTSIVSFQPARMSNEVYDTYNRILTKWLGDNGFVPPTRDEIYVFVPETKTSMRIYVDSIEGIKPLTDKSSQISFKDEIEEVNVIIVNESAEEIRKRAYILD